MVNNLGADDIAGGMYFGTEVECGVFSLHENFLELNEVFGVSGIAYRTVRLFSQYVTEQQFEKEKGQQPLKMLW